MLNITRLGEKSVVLHCLSPDFGRRSFVATVSRNQGMAYYLPLKILDFEVVENQHSDLWRIRSVSAVYPLSGIRSSIGKNTMTLFMSEVLYRTIRDGACEDGLFEWCERSILTLDAMESDYANYHLRFLMELATVLGFAPSVEGLAPFAGDMLPALARMLKASFPEAMMLPLNGAERNGMAQVLLQYISCHVDARIEARSLPVLRELFT